MKSRKYAIWIAAAAVGIVASVQAAPVSAEMSQATAAGFLSRTGVGPLLLPGREVASAEARGNVWIVRLAPSGYIEVAGSTTCAPILSFSAKDFIEPEVGSPFAAKLSADSQMVAEKESGESAADHADWAKLTAPVAKKRAMLAAPAGTTSVVGPLMNCGWGQTAPYNDLSPLSSLCGCMATAAGQEHRYWRWPYRYEKSRQGNHGLRNSLGEYSEHVLRPDGRVPFNYDKVVAYAPNPSSTPLAADKEATYQTAWLSLWMQSLTGMSYKPGASGGTQKLCNFAEQYWFEAGPVMSYWRDGYTNLWNAIKADLDFGSPIQVNSPGHQMVVDGYAIENEGAAGEVHYVNINYGWGSPEGWVNLLTAVTENTSGGRLADFQIGYRPQKIVQFEPVPKVCASDVTLAWHLPPCYTNKITGFALTIAKNGGTPTTTTIPSVGGTTERYTYTATGLETGGNYTFTVTPVMSDNSEARSNSATTTIGTPKAAPEIRGVSSVACGIELMQQGLFVECGRGMTNQINVACSTSVTRLDAYSSHLTVLPDNKVSCVDNGNGSWTVNVDATSMSKDWEGDMLILTLVAANADGTEAYKNLMLRFNSMRNVLGGTFEIVETSATSPVWFAGGTTTTLDAKGQAVTFASGAVNGTGTIILTDSVGNGSFTFQGQDGFTGTLKWAPSVTVNLPADMSNFAGTLNFDSYASTYRLSSSLGANAKVYIGGTTQLYIDGSATVDAAVTGGGYIMVVGSAPTFGNLSGFTGHISLGDFDRSGTVTIPAGQEKGVVIDNGTVNLVLSKAQVAYGYSTTAITMQGWGSVVFKDELGNVLQSWNSSQSSYSIASTANTWTPDSSTGTGNFWDAARWSQGLPNAGDYVIFNDTVGDSEMTLNLSSDFNLGSVLVTGTKLKISEATGSATLSVDTFRNTAIAAIATLKCAPTTVVPEGKLRLQSGLGINCEVDSSLADNMKWYGDDTVPAMYFEDIWKGTVVFTGYAAANLDLSYWANDDSVVRLNGVTGYLKPNTVFPYAVELVDNGDSSALNWSNGSSGAQSTFNILTGTGTFQTTAVGGNNEKALIKDVSGFTGSFNLAAKNVAIADTMPDDATGNNGRLYVNKVVQISSNKTWAANGGLYLGADGRLTVNGAFATGSAINTYGAGAVLTIEDGGHVKVNGAISGDNAPTLNFKAGTYQITRSLTETKTVNFCAAAGKYTTLDANGNTFTLGANFFSGSGDVYLKTSASGGAFVIRGISASYTGTIYVDNSIGLTISGDLSQMGGKINISDITLSRTSSNIGKIDVCSGATLQVVLTDDEAMEGLTVTGVTLSGGTIEFVDQRGTVVGSSTESTVYTKPADYTVPSPEPTAIWYGDFSSAALTQFAGYTIDDWNETHGENMSSVTIDRNNQGLLVDFARAKGYFTVLVKYSNLAASIGSKRVLFATTANSDKTRDRCGIRLLTDSKVQGLWNAATDSNNDADYGAASTGTVPSSGTLAFVYDRGASGTSMYAAGNDESLSETALWNNAALKAGDAYGFAVGGMCREAAVSGVEAAKGMTITGLAVFDRVLTTSELKYFRWPEESSGEDPEPTLEVTPASGAVAAGTKMTVTCSDPDATIWYKRLTDTDYSVYTEPVALETGINYLYVKVNDGEATLYTYIVSAPEPVYEGPAPVAVWVAGEFGDDRSAHGGLEFELNGNTTNALGQIVIGSATTLGATVALPDATHKKMTMLVKYSIPSGGAPVANSVPASMFSTYDIGARAAQAASSALDGYWYNGSSVQAGTYAFSTPAQTMPQEGYILISTWATNANPNDHGTAVYSGETLSTLSGGEKTGLRFTGADRYIASVGVGGPTVAGAKPWAGMVVKSVALFDDWVTPSDLANYSFPAQGAVRPVDPDRYAIEPVASWVNDFKTTEKGDYTLSVSGTTAAKDDTFGGILTIGDAAAVIDTTAASSSNMTVLIKYRAASSVTTAPVVAFGGMVGTIGLDVGVYTKSDKTLAVYRNFNNDNGKPYDFATAPTLSANGGYVLCARDNGQQCMAYVGDSLDAMTGGTVSHANIKFSNVPLTKLGIGGNSSVTANANDMVPFTGFVVEKVVVFNGYYTPEQIRYVENPEDGTTLSIASGATWRFAAGETRTYTNIGTLSEGGAIAITNAATLAEGTYKLAEWTTPQQYTTVCAGYGKVGTLVTDGLAEGLSARLIYGARAIYLRVDDTAKQAARKPLVVWCYGDSITEGFNAQATGANYRILLYQKLEMLGYNVRSTGIYGLSNGYNSVDPTGTALTDQYRWHSAMHGATAAPSSLAHRSNLSESVDTLAIQVGTPDVALLLIGVNDLPQFTTVEPVFKAWTNVVNRLVNNLPNTKIIVSTLFYSDGKRSDDLDDRITTINNNYIKPLMAAMPTAWQGHVFLADLNSYVKSGQPGIIYSDHLHPDWWGYDQMADGYLEKIVECYPDPDATNFPSQNPIPAAPAENQLGAANKPELAAYRAGFTKLCNIRVEKGQDVSNVVYDDVNSAAASNNLEKVGYFVEFVRDDNHAHKWVWVDMDAFGDADLASVGLPQRIYQQAVTKLHVCSNHGAIDNVAADDDSVTGWIEFSPYNYSNPQSNASAPENYGNPYDWNDTLSQSGSYGCMQVFRVMNPSSRNLYERPQLIFAFNNFQSANSNPVDFGIGNFAQHFNCNNAYHTEDWTGVGGTLAKMAPEAYSVKTIEIWTKAATPAYVRDNIVKRADGTVYHGNDENRAVITNWVYQINRPVAPPAPNTIDLLYVLDRPSREYIENTKNMSMEEFFAKSTALMNQMLCPTDMDTNFWFRMVGVYPLDVQAQEVSPMLARSKNSSEPGFELVNEMRNRVGADIVFSVARNGGGIGGLAYVNSYENIMSGAAAPLGHACGFLEYSQMISWVHEIAHVMSCNHTPPTNIDVNNPRHRQFGVVVHDDNATEAPFDYRTIMTGWYYGGQTYCFSSRNHYYNGVQLSVSNHVDATQVMVELAPSVAQWRPTKVPERPEITFFPQDQAEIPAGVETMVSINYGDPEAEIYWYDATSGEGKSDARLYTGPISVVGGSWKMLYAFAKTNGVEVAGSEKTATYFLTGMYGRFDYSQVLDSDGITWSMPLGDSSDFAWDKDTENFCAGESSYRAHVDMESLTNSRPSTCSATAMLTLSEARNLNFRHLDSYTNAMFSVWVDDVPVYYKKGASDTGGEWRKEVIRIEPGTHRIEFVFTQTAEERVDAQTSEGDEHALVDDEKYQRYLASLVAAETSRVWIDGFEWTPTDMTWSGDETTGDGVWATDTSYAPWEGGVSFADDAVVTFPELAAGSPTVVVKGMVRPSKVNFTGVNTAYTFVPQDENAFIYISNGSSTEFKTNAAIRVPFRLDAAYISSAAKCTLELGNVFGHGLIGPGSEGSFWGQVLVNSKSTVIMNPGAGRTQTVGDFGKNWSYTDSDLVFTNGTVKVNGTINGGNGLFQYKRIHVKNGAVLELVTTDATGYDVAANNTIEVERGGELRIDAGDRLRRPMKLSGGKLTVSRSGSVHALALYNNPSFTVTADSVLTNGNAAATFGFVGQDATIALQNDATLDCYVPFANGIMDGDNKNVTITGSGTFVQNVLMIQFTNKVTVANGVTFRQNAVTSGIVGKSSWDVNGTLEANAIMQVSALTLADGATLSVKVTDANVSNAAILCDATPSLAGSIVVNAASDLANGKYAVISATGLEDGLLARVSAPALAKRATFAVEEGGLFMTVADYTEEAFTDTDYPVPYSWMMEYYPNLRGNPSANTELQAVQPAASAAHDVWECYVLGLDPTNALSRFTATIRMEGQKPVVEYFPTNEVLKANGAIEYILQGKPALSNDWQNVTFEEPGATNRFFRVKVTW